jgi:hypothetical protein
MAQLSQVVCDAIRERLLLQGTYHGAFRIFEPYCHGKSPHDDEVVLGYQREGTSKSGAELGWRCFHVTEFQDLSTLDVRFIPTRRDYNPWNDVLAELHCAIRPVDGLLDR